MKLTKPLIWKSLIGVYILISLIFMGYTCWSNFKLHYIQQSYAAGQQDTISQFITQANDKACQPFYVYNATDKVQVINVTCLQNTASDAATTTTEAVKN